MFANKKYLSLGCSLPNKVFKMSNKNHNKYFKYTINVPNGKQVGRYPIPNIKPFTSLKTAMQYKAFQPEIANIGIKFYADSDIGVADIDYPIDSEYTKAITNFLPCICCESRGNNAHAFIRLSNEMKNKHGMLRDTYGNILVHPANPKKKTEIKIFSHGNNLACNFGIKSLIEYGANSNEVDNYEDWFINSLHALPIADKHLLEVLKYNYPKPPKAPPKLPKAQKTNQNGVCKSKFSLLDNIDYLQHKIAPYSGNCSEDFNRYAIFIGSTLARSGNLSFENLEFAMSKLVPETFNGKYSRQYKKYTPSHQQKMLVSAMNQIGKGV